MSWTRAQTVFLGIIAATLSWNVVRPALVADAHAQAQTLRCETWTFDLDIGKKSGAANVELHRTEMEARLNRMYGPGAHTAYSNSFPIVTGLNSYTEGWMGVVCVAR